MLSHHPLIDRETPWHWRDGGEPLEMSDIIIVAIANRPGGGEMTAPIARDLVGAGLIDEAARLTVRGQAIREAYLQRQGRMA